jgi:hypothetical protein
MAQAFAFLAFGAGNKDLETDSVLFQNEKLALASFSVYTAAANAPRLANTVSFRVNL